MLGLLVESAKNCGSGAGAEAVLLPEAAIGCEREQDGHSPVTTLFLLHLQKPQAPETWVRAVWLPSRAAPQAGAVPALLSAPEMKMGLWGPALCLFWDSPQNRKFTWMTEDQ